MPSQPKKSLDTFPNPNPDRDYIIEITAPEFTCLCPKTGQPDFATLYLDYVPDRLCVELKSLKLYIWSFRDEGAFHEDVTNRIAGNLVNALDPRYLKLTMEFYVRGGIYTTVTVEHCQTGWQAPPPVTLPGTPPAVTARERVELVGHDAPVITKAETASTTPPENTGRRFRMLGRTKRPATERETARLASSPSPSGPTVSAPLVGAPFAESPSVAPPPAARSPSPPARVDAPPPRTPPKTKRPAPVYLGIDLGSTGCRVVAVNEVGEKLAESQSPIPAAVKKDEHVTQDPTRWWKAVSDALSVVLMQVDPLAVRAMSVDGTSGTVLLTDAAGHPTTPAIMYNDQRALAQAERIAKAADSVSGAQGATSSLAKLLWLQDKELDKRATHLLHQADWIAGRLSGVFGVSDYNNCLKLGYDAENLRWPAWFAQLDVRKPLLPTVHAPGTPFGKVSEEAIQQFGFHPDTEVLAGTTDGVAAFLAAGANKPGEAVTALGTTLVLKLLSDTPVFSSEHGVYSHRLGNFWLAGGASNSGGAVLLQYFKVEQMREMTPMLDPETFTGLQYYPLPDIGERFPLNDPTMVAQLEPLPGNTVTFFQGLLEGIGAIEALGYQVLEKMGAPKLASVSTTGGGAANPAWMRLRERILNVPVKRATADAAYGTALLAAGIVTKIFS